MTAASTPIFDAWIAERCDVSDATAATNAGALYANFRAYCEGLGLALVPTQTTFGSAMSARGLPVFKTREGLRYRRGIALVSPADARPAQGARASGRLGRALSRAASRLRPSRADEAAPMPLADEVQAIVRDELARAAPILVELVVARIDDRQRRRYR